MSKDIIADAFNTIKTHEHVGKQECRVKASKLLGEILVILERKGYISSHKFFDDGKQGYFVVQLSGMINDCGVIKPRFPVKKGEWARFEERFLPSFGMGLLIVSSSKGLMTNVEAHQEQIGGRLLAYIY